MIKVLHMGTNMDVPQWRRSNGLYRYEGSEPGLAMVDVLRDGRGTRFLFRIERGFGTDGLSTPPGFRHLVPRWTENIDYDLAGIIHDGLYGTKGYGIFGRSEADDFLRGLMRESGMERFRASLACWCVNRFARRHWGLDREGFARFFSVLEA